MKLHLLKSHLSIREFPDTVLPPFTIITGLNGAGKTHLLRAIAARHIEVEGIGKTELRLCSWADLAPSDSGPFSSHLLGEERRELYAALSAHRTTDSEIVLSTARKLGLSGPVLNRVEDIASLTVDDLSRIGAQAPNLTQFADSASGALSALQEAVSRLSAKINGHLDDNKKLNIGRIAAAAGKQIAALTEADFSLSSYPDWGTGTLFQQAFGRIFVQYMELLKANRLRRERASYEKVSEPYYTEEEFRQRYREPPWEFVNEALEDAGLGFTINHPDPFEVRPFLPRLTKILTGAEIAFGDLSSGERILMSFALVVYQALDDRPTSSYPKLLLLDEVDAPLHPSMCRHLVDTIERTLVGRHSIKVIATTHSPSTVAIAPKGSLYCMVAGVAGLEPISKAKALNLLTAGVPTLAISHSGRRQVFVESPNDSDRYNDLFQKLKSVLDTERSLDFIATGSRDHVTGGEQNTGRQAVERIVKGLVACGNQTVFGLIDWDNTASPSERIFVLGEGKRYAIENVLLDPLPLLGLILKHPRGVEITKRMIPAAADLTFAAYLNLPPEGLQPLVDILQDAVLGTSDQGPLDTAEYQGGFSLSIRRTYMRMNGHDLQTRVVAAFPELRAYGQNDAALLGAVISNVFREQISYIPSEISAVFSALLTASVHLDQDEDRDRDIA